MSQASVKRLRTRFAGRSAAGSITILYVALLSFVLLTLLVPALGLIQAWIMQERQSKAVAAASLAAANDLAKIVIDDPYFGFIGLNDYSPVAAATKALDGQPLPVLGLNTLWATCRQQMLLAEALDSPTMRELANQDLAQARRASDNLTNVLRRSLKPNCACAFDHNGRTVAPYFDAVKAYSANTNGCLSGMASNTDLELDLGWIDDLADSCANVPQPAKLAQLRPGMQVGEHYRACINIPVGKTDYYFAAFSKQAAIVDPLSFRMPDDKRLCSAVRVVCDCAIADQPGYNLAKPFLNGHVRSVACAVAPSCPDNNLPGIFRLEFGQGLISEYGCMRDLLTHASLAQSNIYIGTAAGGDYPTDANSYLKFDSQNRPASYLIARALFDWLRTAHNKPRLDSLQTLFVKPFSLIVNQVSNADDTISLNYQFDRSGDLLVTAAQHNPFPRSAVSENQMVSVSPNLVQLGRGWLTVDVKDQVAVLGRTNGGKHAGQPIPGDPINWSELPYYGGSRALADSIGNGEHFRGLLPVGDISSRCGDDPGVALTNVVFKHADYSALYEQPRVTYYSSGLACELRLNCSSSQ